MSILCTVRFRVSLERVERVEREQPEVMQRILEPAKRYMTSHRRVAQGSEVLDLDEYANRDDYEKFIAEAGPAIAELAEHLGIDPEDTIWEVVDG